MDLSKLKIKFQGAGSFQPPKPVPLTTDTEIGINITHNGITGLLLGWDGKKAVIKLDNGQSISIEI